MASILKVDTITGVATAGSIAITGEGNSTTTNLQQGLAKMFGTIDADASTAVGIDTFNVSAVQDNGAGKFGFNFTSNMGNTGYFYSTKSTYHNTTSDYDRHISAQYSSGMDARRTTSEALIGSFNSGYADTLQVGGATFGDLA